MHIAKTQKPSGFLGTPSNAFRKTLSYDLQPEIVPRPLSGT